MARLEIPTPDEMDDLREVVRRLVQLSACSSAELSRRTGNALSDSQIRIFKSGGSLSEANVLRLQQALTPDKGKAKR